MRTINYYEYPFSHAVSLISAPLLDIGYDYTFTEAKLHISYFAFSGYPYLQRCHLVVNDYWEEMEATYNHSKSGVTWINGAYSNDDVFWHDPDPAYAQVIGGSQPWYVEFNVTQILNLTPSYYSKYSLAVTGMSPSLGSCRYDTREALLPGDRPYITFKASIDCP